MSQFLILSQERSVQANNLILIQLMASLCFNIQINLGKMKFRFKKHLVFTQLQGASTPTLLQKFQASNPNLAFGFFIPESPIADIYEFSVNNCIPESIWARRTKRKKNTINIDKTTPILIICQELEFSTRARNTSTDIQSYTHQAVGELKILSSELIIWDRSSGTPR